jgi:hypothetical protein
MMDQWHRKSVSRSEWAVFSLIAHFGVFVVLISIFAITSLWVDHNVNFKDGILYATAVSAGLDLGAMICQFVKWRAGE